MRSKIPPKHLRGGEKIWVIRAGIAGEADQLFLSEGMIILRDPGMGDLKKIPRRREAFYEAYRKLRPDETQTGIAGIGGKFFRFIHEVAVGDLVLYPRLKDSKLYIGRITGRYRYSKKLDKDFPHQRKVVWLASVPKLHLSAFAARELGAARTFFQMKTNVEEIRRLLKKSRLRKMDKKTV